MDRCKLFISAVTDEFREIRNLLHQKLSSDWVGICIQEGFTSSGLTTLAMLDEQIRNCDEVVHVVGKVTGSVPRKIIVNEFARSCPETASTLRTMSPIAGLPDGGIEMSYTQWEAYLALAHGRRLHICRARSMPDEDSGNSQLHLRRLRELGYYPAIEFENELGLVVELQRMLLNNLGRRQPEPPVARQSLRVEIPGMLNTIRLVERVSEGVPLQDCRIDGSRQSLVLAVGKSARVDLIISGLKNEITCPSSLQSRIKLTDTGQENSVSFD